MGPFPSANGALPWQCRPDTSGMKASEVTRFSSVDQREAAEIEAAIRLPTQRWLALAGLVWRTAGLVVAVQGAWIWLQAEALLLGVTVVVILANVTIMVA